MRKNVLTFGRVFGMSLLVIGLVALAGCQAEPDAVAIKLAEAVNAQDLDGALALFADDAVVNSGGPEPFTGKAEIQGWLEGMFADNFKLEIEILEVSGDKVVEKDTMTMDSLSALGLGSLEGISEITVQGGKITALDFIFSEESLAELQIVMQQATAPTATLVPTVMPEPTKAPEATATLQLTPTPRPNPPARGVPRMTYDAESDRVILFGGYMAGTGRAYKDTWSYDFSTNTWRQMRPTPSPGKSDGPMAYDAGSDRVILFIGSTSETGDHYDLAPGSETWVYDFDTNTWTNMEPAEAPYGLKGARMVYDVESDRMILFGGWATNLAGGGFNDTWAYDYDTNAWTRMEPEVSPPSRYYHAMAYDAESDRVILWGGYGPVPIDVSSVWAYDYNADVWEELESSGVPSPVGYGAMVYDATADRITLYAGKELWAFDYDTNTWIQLSESPLPGKLFYHAMVYSGEADRVITFGGGPTLDFHTDKTWIYDLNTNTWTDVTRRP